MHVRAVVEAYVEALDAGDDEAVVDLFAPEAVVTSPLRESVPARQFYTDLIEDSRESQVELVEVFTGDASAAAQLAYDWTLSDGTRTAFDCVDVFRFDDEGQITSLRIFYDPSEIQDAYEAVRSEA